MARIIQEKTGLDGPFRRKYVCNMVYNELTGCACAGVAENLLEKQARCVGK
jgi:hypothetical protein